MLLPSLELLDEFGQRREFFGIDQLELVYEEDEVLEARVQVVLQSQAHYVVEVAVVHMRVHSEQSLEYYFDDALEASGEWHLDLGREYGLIVELALDPGHEEVDVLACGDLKRRLDVVAVGPEVLVLGAG